MATGTSSGRTIFSISALIMVNSGNNCTLCHTVHSIMESNTINHYVERSAPAERIKVCIFICWRCGTPSSQYSLFIIIDKVTLTDSVNSRRGRKKRGDYQIIIIKLTFSSLIATAEKQPTVLLTLLCF